MFFLARPAGSYTAMDMDVPSHEINIPTNWPTVVGTDEPLRYAYRTMRPDLRELLYKHHEFMDIDRETNRIRWLKGIMSAVADGSHHRSPFYHLSKTGDCAYCFAMLGQRVRKETPEEQIFTRVDLLAMYQDSLMVPNTLIDISTRDAVKQNVRTFIGN